MASHHCVVSIRRAARPPPHSGSPETGVGRVIAARGRSLFAEPRCSGSLAMMDCLRLRGDSSIDTGMEWAWSVEVQATRRFPLSGVACCAGVRDGCAVTHAAAGSRGRSPCVGCPGHGGQSLLAAGSSQVWKHPTQASDCRALGGSVSAFHPARKSAAGRSRVNALVAVLYGRGRRRQAEYVGDDGLGDAQHRWRTGRAGRVCVGGRWCARQTGEGQPVEVRRKEGVTDHLHPESCAGRCEAAGEALTGARTDGAIEHRKQRVLERRDCHRGRRPHRHHRDG